VKYAKVKCKESSGKEHVITEIYDAEKGTDFACRIKNANNGQRNPKKKKRN
jgi:hypothetical protein